MDADRELRDPELDALVREHSAETPPARVDAAILAAAHRAVRGEGRRHERALAGRRGAGGCRLLPQRWWASSSSACCRWRRSRLTRRRRSSAIRRRLRPARAQWSSPTRRHAEPLVREARIERPRATGRYASTRHRICERSAPSEPASNGFAARESRQSADARAVQRHCPTLPGSVRPLSTAGLAGDAEPTDTAGATCDRKAARAGKGGDATRVAAGDSPATGIAGPTGERRTADEERQRAVAFTCRER